jgi:hypothetical protein
MEEVAGTMGLHETVWRIPRLDIVAANYVICIQGPR